MQNLSLPNPPLSALWLFLTFLPYAQSDSLSELFYERVRSVAAVEFFIQREVERQPVHATGLVIDSAGTVVLLESVVPGWLPVSWLKEFKVILPGNPDQEYQAEYLGQDVRVGWHYLRVADQNFRQMTIPCRAFAVATPQIGEKLWGIGLQGKDFGYQPYYLETVYSFLYRLPEPHGITQAEVAAPGAPVFHLDGRLVGWAQLPLAQERSLTLGGDTYPVGWNNPQESNNFLLAETFLSQLGRIPSRPEGDAVPWLGIAGVQALEKESLRFLSIADAGAVVISTIIPGSPAEKAGFLNKDILLEIDSRPIPRFRPASLMEIYVERAILGLHPGMEVPFTVLRGEQKTTLTATLEVAPKSLREAERLYFPKIGLGIRECLLIDLIHRRKTPQDKKGAIVTFINPNGPAETAGLLPGDWIWELDGKPVQELVDLQERLSQEKSTVASRELVFLLARENETKIIRLPLP